MDFEGFGKRIWADNPQREERLLTWLDEHPDETKIMFSKSKRGSDRGRRPRGTLSKARCYELASSAVFSVDEDPALRDQLSKDPQHLNLSTRNRIESWKRKYQRFNSEIGETASNTPFEEIEAESKAYKDIKEQLVYFPLWTRLHVHWRTLPNLNRFYRSSTSATEGEDPDTVPPDALPTAGPPVKRRRKASKKAVEADRDESPDHQASPDADSDIVDVDGPWDAEEVKEITSENAKEIIQRKLNTLKRKHGDNNQIASTSQTDDNTDDIKLTAAQKHERKLAELAVRLQTLENEALEKKNAAELRRLEIEAEERRRIAEHNNQRAREKHELMMKMMTMAMGKGVPDGAVNT